MRKIKVFILVPELLRGGAQRIILDIAENHSKDKLDISVVTLKARSNFGEEVETLEGDIKKSGVRVIEIKGERRFNFSEFIRLLVLLHKERPDILHTYLPYAGIVGRIAGRLANIPVIISTQCNLPSAYTRRVYWLDKVTLPLAHAWTAATEGIERAYGGTVEYVSEKLLKEGRRHFSIVAGVDLIKIENLKSGFNREAKRAELDLKEEDIAIMMTARLISWKGHAHFIEAIQKITKKVKVFFVGWGPLEDSLKKKRDSLHLTDKITFLGSRDDVLELLNAMDIYAQTHVKDSKGNIWVGPNTAQMEACAVGVPSISSAVPEVDFLIQNHVTGILYPVGDAEELANAITYLASHGEEAKKIAERARRIVEERYSVSAMIRAYEILYTQLTRKSAPKKL